MTTTTFYGSTGDGYSLYNEAAYPPTVPGVGSNVAVNLLVGQHKSGPTYYNQESGISFDTSSLSGATISSAVLSLYGKTDNSTTNFTVEARVYDFGASWTDVDYRTPAELGSCTLVASLSTVGFSVAGYNDFTDVALPANINKTGTTYLVLASDRFRGGTTPTGAEYVDFYSYDQGDPYRPKLTVTYTTTSIKSVGGVAQASIKSVAGVPIASVKSVAGVT